jgi:hypothetical protein
LTFKMLSMGRDVNDTLKPNKEIIRINEAEAM